LLARRKNTKLTTFTVYSNIVSARQARHRFRNGLNKTMSEFVLKLINLATYLDVT